MPHFECVCLDCDAVQADARAGCARCGGALGFRYDLAGAAPDDRFRGMWRWWRLLPLVPDAGLVTLGEGATPLLRSRGFAGREVWFKDETRNPTGSHKDRALAVALNHARQVGARASIVVSAGSTGLSNAAYAARAGLASVAIAAKGTPAQRLYPLAALGSTILEVDAEIDPVIAEVTAIGRAHGLYVSSTTRTANAHQAEGCKTIAYEIVEQLGGAPDWLIVPTGGGGTLSGLWRGFKELAALRRTRTLPRLVAVVPEHHNALEVAFARGIAEPDTYLALPFADLPASILSKLAHAHPPDGIEALAALRESGGMVFACTDEAGLAGQQRIGRAEGLYCEPSSGVLADAIDRLLATGAPAPTDRIVAILSGSGFRETFLEAGRRPLATRTVALGDLAGLLVAFSRPSAAA